MMQGVRGALREATGAAHERLDALFATFDLATRDGYARFLTAHAMALPALERALDEAGFADDLADWPARQRSAALAGDLAALGLSQPSPLPAPALAGPGERWGAAYVLEGSRLGGAMLARQVGSAMPHAYLATPQAPGAWRQFLGDLEAAVADPAAIDHAIAGATAGFALFEAAGARMAEVPAA